MKKTDSVKLVQHIEDAEDWLKKAKNEYREANPIRGELILNLAQAEVKHAWELSHHQYVSDVKKPTGMRKIKFFVPAAVSVGIILSVTLIMQFDKFFAHSQPDRQPVKPDFTVNETLVNRSSAPQETGVIHAASKQAARISSKTSRDVSESGVSANESANVSPDPVTQNEPVDKPDSTSNINEPDTSGQKLAGTTETVRERGTTQNQPDLQPVSQLAIDEETLTKEASHNLRNGK